MTDLQDKLVAVILADDSSAEDTQAVLDKLAELFGLVAEIKRRQARGETI